ACAACPFSFSVPVRGCPTHSESAPRRTRTRMHTATGGAPHDTARASGPPAHDAAAAAAAAAMPSLLHPPSTRLRSPLSTLPPTLSIRARSLSRPTSPPPAPCPPLAVLRFVAPRRCR